MELRFWAAVVLSPNTLHVFEVENHSFFNPWSIEISLFLQDLKQ